MKRHPFDPLSFAFGIAFVLLAGALSFEGLDLDMPVLRWVGAGVLLLLGIVMLVTSKTGTDRE